MEPTKRIFLNTMNVIKNVILAVSSESSIKQLEQYLKSNFKTIFLLWKDNEVVAKVDRLITRTTNITI